MAQKCFLALAIQPRSSEESSPSFIYTRRSYLKTTFAESTSGRCLRGRLGVLIITWPGSGLNWQLRIAGLSDTRFTRQPTNRSRVPPTRAITKRRGNARSNSGSLLQETFHHGLLAWIIHDF